MKNIHVLPTDKPSRLAYDFDKLILNSKLLSPTLYKNQNIYITSDEGIKDGDWCFGMDGIFQYKGKVNLPDVELPKKIILTTDQDLIKDGVQAIDDEFLEWFVKNPSCESVKIESLNIGNSKVGYVICKPQEEPKQETLEEIILPIGDFIIENTTPIQGADGAYYHYSEVCKLLKLQAERMYSEEEVRKLLETQRGNCYVAILTKTRDEELATIAGGAPEPSGYNGWVK
jgi:hypothetical protein